MLKKCLLLMVMLLGTVGFGGIAQGAPDSTLSDKQKSIVTIAAFTAQGDLENLKTAINSGLNNGLTVNEIKEVLIQMYAYCGFPRSLNGLNTFIAVLDERKADGIIDEIGVEANPVDPNRDRYAIGDKIQTELVGRPVSGRVYDFAPTIGTFLKEHLFCDIFERGILTTKDREIATVSALAAIGNVNPQLTGHMNCSLNAGVTPEQLQEIVDILEEKVSAQTGMNAQTVLNGVSDR